MARPNQSVEKRIVSSEATVLETEELEANADALFDMLPTNLQEELRDTLKQTIREVLRQGNVQDHGAHSKGRISVIILQPIEQYDEEEPETHASNQQQPQELQKPDQLRSAAATLDSILRQPHSLASQTDYYFTSVKRKRKIKMKKHKYEKVKQPLCNYVQTGLT